MAVSPISPEQEMTGVLLEAMNAESYYGDAMAYYDVVLKHKAMRDEDSIRMLEIIRSTRTMNFEYAFGYLGLQSVYNDVLNKGRRHVAYFEDSFKASGGGEKTR